MENKMLEFIAPGIASINNLIPNIGDFLEKIQELENQNQLKWTEASVAGNDSGEIKNKNIRDTSILGIPMPSPESEPPAKSGSRLIHELGCTFRDTFKPYIDLYTSYFGVQIQEYDHYQLMRYGIGQKFDKHMDDHFNYPRRISLIYYANDAYEGGELEFDQFKLKIKPSKGQLVLFPSSYVYSHTVHPVTSGIRYSLVQWMK